MSRYEPKEAERGNRKGERQGGDAKEGQAENRKSERKKTCGKSRVRHTLSSGLPRTQAEGHKAKRVETDTTKGIKPMASALELKHGRGIDKSRVKEIAKAFEDWVTREREWEDRVSQKLAKDLAIGSGAAKKRKTLRNHLLSTVAPKRR